MEVRAAAFNGGDLELVGVGEFLDVGAGDGVAGVKAADEFGSEVDVGLVDLMSVEEGGEKFGAAFEENVGVIEMAEMAEGGGDG